MTTYTVTIRPESPNRRRALLPDKHAEDLTRDEAVALVLTLQDAWGAAEAQLEAARALLWALVVEAGGEVELDREQLRLYPDRLVTHMAATAGGVRLTARRKGRR